MIVAKSPRIEGVNEGPQDVFEMRRTPLPGAFLIFISSFRICIPETLARLSDRSQRQQLKDS